ncbi:MAG: thioester reductase domain-containing protein [Nannocystaceae bacterium]
MSGRSDLERAADALRRARARILALERADAAPVAIVGVGLRLPGGVDSLDGLWGAIVGRRDLTGPPPPERRAELAGLELGGDGALHGGWLGEVDRFDAPRFGVGEREAATMDPQHRLLLEAAHAAIERAALGEDELARSRTGVYVGLCNNDYAQRLLREPGDPRIDATFGPGNCYSMAAGRIAYAFGLQGPAFAVDAACASSLLAVHLGVQAIRRGECERALCGGANLLLSPNPSLAFARMGVLSPSGRCRAMDAAADGYLRAEGAVILVLEALERARAAGRPIVAVIHGSAARQSGSGSGVVAPNPGAQEAVIQAALRDAGVAPAEVGLLAAFGSGTALGDLAEVTAIERVFAGDRAPLWLALTKPNFGHSEGAAGATSLLLACAALERRTIPPALQERGPSPRLPWAVARLASEARPWGDPRPIAGVSAFGFSGTHVHVIVGAAPGSGESAELDPVVGAAPGSGESADLDPVVGAGRGVGRDRGPNAHSSGDPASHRRGNFAHSGEPVEASEERPKEGASPRAVTPGGVLNARERGPGAPAPRDAAKIDFAHSSHSAGEAARTPDGSLDGPPGPGPQIPAGAASTSPSPGAHASRDRFDGPGPQIPAGAKAPLSARSEPLLRDDAAALAAYLRARPSLPLAGIAATLARGRAREAVVAGVAIDDRDALLADLDRLAAGERLPPPGDDAPAPPEAPRVALPPRTLERRRHWIDHTPAVVAPAPAPLPDLELLRAAPRPARQAAIARALARLLAAPLGRAVDPAASLAELGVDSLLAVDLLARVREAWGLTVFPGELFAQPSVDGLAELLAGLLEGPREASEAEAAAIARTLALGLRRGRPAPADEPPAGRGLPPPIFVLSTPRSGSTLLRAMLGGHPALFAPPELHLLAFADLADWHGALAPDLLHLGLHQALAGLGLDDPAIEAEVAAWVADRRPIPAIYDALRARVAPRHLVDKSPSYCLDRAILDRAERLFPGARYLHLVRHPVPASRSFVERRMGRLLGGDALGGPRAAEAVWTLGNRNLLEFLEAIGPGRSLRIRYEDLVGDPPATLARIARFLEIEDAPAMRDPHARRFPGEERGVIGDPGFYARRGVDPGLADAWLQEPVTEDMSKETVEIAARLGYRIPAAAGDALATITLDPSIAPRGPAPARPPRRILLTGATGFLGPWLLRALLRRTPAEVIALVRAGDDEAARGRLRAALAPLGGVDEIDGGRVQAIAGRLDRPRLGLDDRRWEALAGEVDLVVHNGAAVNFVRGWSELAAINVGGTEEALRLAAAGRPAGFVHVSTKGVFDPAVHDGEGPLREDDPVRTPTDGALGYQRSKWAAEALVRQAGARGLPVAIARPGRIVGDVDDGALPEGDFMVLFLRGCLEVGALPRLSLAIEASPVDVVAAAIAEIAARDRCLGHAHHLTHPRPIDLAEVATITADLGLPLELVDYRRWRERLLERAAGPGSALAPLLSMFPAHEPARIDDRRLARDQTERALEGADVVWPPMEVILRSSLGYMRRRGWIG